MLLHERQAKEYAEHLKWRSTYEPVTISTEELRRYAAELEAFKKSRGEAQKAPDAS